MVGLAIAVVSAVVMLVWVNRILRRNGRPTFGVLLVCLLLSGLPVALFLFQSSYPLLAQGFLLAVTLPLAYIPRRGPLVYRYTSITLAVGLWVLTAVNVVRTERRYAEWREEYPFESLAKRLPEPKASDVLPAELPLLRQWESEFEQRSNKFGVRENALRAVHEHRVQLFLEAAGFGAIRMRTFTPQAQHFETAMIPIIPQGDEYVPGLVSLGEQPPADKQELFEQLHTNSVLDFLNPAEFGYVKNRDAVAGFRPHHFVRFPPLIERWTVSRIELVSLLKHDPPEVYVSELLPRMDQLNKAPTRELDAFEGEGLRAIRDGAEIFTRGGDENIRMVGAIRSVKQCVECHGGKRGDLLGAFTYRVWHLGEPK